MTDYNIGGEATINFNRECIKYTSNWSGTVYYNLCNGKQVLVPTGSWDITWGVIAVITVVVAVASVGTIIGCFAVKLVSLLIDGEQWG